MGRKVIQKALRKRSIAIVITGALLFLLMALFAAAFAVTGEIDGVFWFFVVIALLGLLLVVLGVRQGSIKSSGWLKRNPNLLEQADELYDNIVYEDKFVVYSDKYISSKREPMTITAFDDIIGMYERKTRYNHMVTVQKELVLVTKRGETSFSIYSDKKINELVAKIHEHCPEAKIGFSPEAQAHYEIEHKAYREQQKAK